MDITESVKEVFKEERKFGYECMPIYMCVCVGACVYAWGLVWQWWGGLVGVGVGVR